MRGTVLHFSIKESKGFISGDDGNRYEFIGENWGLKQTPEQGARVDFGIEGESAIKIFEDPDVLSRSPKSRRNAAAWALLLGGLGAHFFYLEAWGWGLVCVVFFWTYIPLILSVIFAVRWYSMSDKEFQQKTKNMKGAFPEIYF